ncbi:surface-adhesin E family protein [Paraburkholderia sp. IW21]|uniref:surface-adhesin E family protein n=1 Tax=Paraburkholderia sp. IW21 TaxID=3242488 RepID=UPI0035230170
MPFITMVVASLNVAAGAAWVPVAASPDVQVFVDAESLQQESHGLVKVWTKTFYASPQGAVGTQYAADMTLFVLDCASHQYGIAGGRYLDAQGNVLRQFHEPVGELQPVPPASKIDAVAIAVCTAIGVRPRGNR